MTFTYQSHPCVSNMSSGSTSTSPRLVNAMNRPRRSSSHSHSQSLSERLSTSPSGSPNASLLASGGRTTAPSFLYLPPGISLQRNGCGEEAQFHSSPSTSSSSSIHTSSPSTKITIGFDHHLEPKASTSSRKSSTSSCSNEDDSSSCDSTCSTSSNSAGPTSSLASSITTNESSSTTPKKRTGSMVTALGEDPQLAAARRALWEDDPEENSPTSEGSTTPNAISRPYFEGVSTIEEAVFDEDDEVEREEFDDEQEGGSEPLIKPHEPSHATLPPLPSCLRPSAPSRTHSSSSLSSSTVRISSEPPQAFTTYSAIDYERKGLVPVEKLSIREWIELQGVREAVGVWSGKITANDLITEEPDSSITEANPIPSEENRIGIGHPSSANGVRRVMSLPQPPHSPIQSSSNELPKRSSSGPSLAVKDDEAEEVSHLLKSACKLGVRTVQHNERPVVAPASLWD